MRLFPDWHGITKNQSFILTQPNRTRTYLGKSYYTNRAITGSKIAKGKGYAYIVKRGKAQYRLDSNSCQIYEKASIWNNR